MCLGLARRTPAFDEGTVEDLEGRRKGLVARLKKVGREPSDEKHAMQSDLRRVEAGIAKAQAREQRAEEEIKMRKALRAARREAPE